MAIKYLRLGLSVCMIVFLMCSATILPVFADATSGDCSSATNQAASATSSGQSNIQGLPGCELQALDEWPNWVTTSGATCAGGASYAPGSLDAFLQAIALHESHGDPKAGSPGAASGKFQFMPNTWQGYARLYYAPAEQYSYASAAPENVQDALAYLANINTYNHFKGDAFWMAIYWYQPAATHAYPNKDDPSLDVVPSGGNTETYANFGNQIAEAVSTGTMKTAPGNDVSGPINKISLNYSSAPDFQTWLAKDGGTPSQPNSPSGTSSPSPAASSSCGGASTTCSPTSGPAKSGPNAAILCEAEKYQNIYYQSGGGHAPYDSFRSQCPENSLATAATSSTAGDPGPCATDCSGLVSVALDGALGQKYTWTVSASGQMEGDGAQYWQSIPLSQAQAGDIVTRPDHVEIVDHVSGNSVFSFGSHETGVRTGPVTTDASYWSGGAWRWTGPGSNK